MIYRPKSNDDEFVDYATQVIVTTGDIYRNHTVPVMKMIAKKVMKDTFDYNLAIKGIVSGIIEPSLPAIKREYNEYTDDRSRHVSKVSMETKVIIAKDLMQEYTELIGDLVKESKKSKRVTLIRKKKAPRK